MTSFLLVREILFLLLVASFFFFVSAAVSFLLSLICLCLGSLDKWTKMNLVKDCEGLRAFWSWGEENKG